MTSSPLPGSLLSASARWIAAVMGAWMALTAGGALRMTAQDSPPVTNQVLVLTGQDGHLELPPGIFDTLTAATVEGWVKFDRLTTARFFDLGDLDHAMTVGLVDSRPDLRFEIWDASRQRHSITAAGVVATNHWLHIAAVSGPGGMKLYVNGALVGALVGRDSFTGSFASIRNGQKNRLGRDNWSEDDRLNRPDTAGQMDAVAVWNRELTPAEIADCLRRPHNGTEPGLVGWWTFDDGTPRDQSPRRHSGQLMGTARIAPAPSPFAGPILPPTRLSGTIADAVGRPLPGAILEIHQGRQSLRRAVADAAGRYQLFVAPDETVLDLSADYETLGTWKLGVRMNAGTLNEIPWRLPAANSLSGSVTALDGSPIEGVVAQAVELAPGTPPETGAGGFIGGCMLTDERGQFRLAHLRPGRYQVRIQVPGRLIENESGPFTLREASKLGPLSFRITPFRKGSWKTLGNREGLDSLSIRCLHVDPDGVHWIGTRNGLSRFDGSQMTTFFTEDGLAGNNIAGIARDTAGHLWIASEDGGLSRSTGTKFTRVELQGAANDRQLQCVHAAQDGTLWAGGMVGLYRVRGTNVLHYTATNGLPARTVYKIDSGADGVLWLGTDAGLIRFDGEKFRNMHRELGLNPFVVDSPRVAPDGSIWFGSWGKGLWRYDPSGIERENLRNWTQTDGLPGNVVWSLEFAPTNVVWISTLTGASRFDGTSFVNFSQSDGLADNHVSMIQQDGDGLLWFATQAGLTRYDPTSATTFTTADGLPSNDIRSAVRDQAGNLWLATAGGLSRWDGQAFSNVTTREGLPSNDIRRLAVLPGGSICLATPAGVGIYDGHGYAPLSAADELVRSITCLSAAADGTIAAGTTGGDLLRWRDPVSPASREAQADGEGIASLLCLSSNRFWIGFSSGGGVARVAPAPRTDGSMQEVTQRFGATNGLADGYGLALAQDRSAQIWVGGVKGVSRFDGTRFTEFNRRRQAGGEAVNALLQDGQNTLWVAKRTGVRFFDGTTWSGLDEEEGLVGNNVRTLVEDSDGALWFG
ncbi:MAG: hypothetical protein RIS76_322, partial [Verrucomicrobiota bacterium]